MKFSHLAIVSTLLVALLASALVMTGCTVSAEKDPAYVKLAARLKALEETQAKNQRSVESIYLDVDILTEELKKVGKEIRTAAAGGNPETEAATMTRLAKIEEQLQTLEQGLAAQKKEIEQAMQSARQVRTPAPSIGAPAAVATPRAGGVRPATTPRVSAAPVQPRGFYYKVAVGDTLQSIAQKNGVSSAEILKANGLPMDAQIRAGQNIFIPKK
jgi:LysM repeat protein